MSYEIAFAYGASFFKADSCGDDDVMSVSSEHSGNSKEEGSGASEVSNTSELIQIITSTKIAGGTIFYFNVQINCPILEGTHVPGY